MGRKRIISHDLCACCKYRMGWGSQPGKEQKVNNNIACNYLSVTGHSRVFVNGCHAYDGRLYCDKFEQGDSLTEKHPFPFVSIEQDEYDKYKTNKIIKEMSSYDYKYKNKHKYFRGHQGENV